MCVQVYAAEAGPEAAQQPIEEAGMSEEVIQKVRVLHTSRFLLDGTHFGRHGLCQKSKIHKNIFFSSP